MNTIQKLRISISVGDFNGIGPEIVLKTLSEVDLSVSTPVIIAPEEVVSFYLDVIPFNLEIHVVTEETGIKDGRINLIPVSDKNLTITPGRQSKQSGKVAMKAIEEGIRLCMEGTTQALVTAPISKEAVNLAGYHIPGHTEFLAEKTDTSSVLMMLVSGNLRVALVTTHDPIKNVAAKISQKLIWEKLDILFQSLCNDFKIDKPKIAVFGLNPHAGDGGVIGMEEIDIIAPAIKTYNEKHNQVIVDGPFPADGFFGQQLHHKFDAILAMYHDQGLAPFKLLSFGKGVNFTAGLPIIRTSPDHGTAFDIAGSGNANPSSFKEAYNLAAELSKRKLREARKS